MTVNVRDPPPSGVTYSMVAVLDARSQKLFSMDGQTGSITTSARLDRESMDVHYLIGRVRLSALRGRFHANRHRRDFVFLSFLLLLKCIHLGNFCC